MTRLFWLTAAALIVAQPVRAAPPSWEFALGADYSTGRYGAESDTNITDSTFSARVQIDRLRLEGLAPLVRVEGPGELINGVLVGTGASSRRSGLGDIGISGAWLLRPGGETTPAIEVAASVKLPTAKTGIGTGKADYGLALNLYQPLSQRLNLFGSLGYSWLTDSAAYALSNGVAAMAAASYRPNDDNEGGISLSYRESVAAGYKAQVTLSPYWTRHVTPRVGLSAYVGVGLTDASSRLGAGVAMKIRR